jgi:hypothetical protein
MLARNNIHSLAKIAVHPEVLCIAVCTFSTGTISPISSQSIWISADIQDVLINIRRI